MLIIGFVSLLLPLLGMKFMFLTWIDQWGSTASWAIRGGITALGLILYLVYRNRD